MAIDFNQTVKLTGGISPTSPLDTYASHFEDFGYGGYRTVADIAERDAITPARRKGGMLVNVLSDGKKYELDGDLTT